ncbi:MAG TPA: hypothetical protein VIN71_13715 [Pseudomonadales bacterium]
MNPNHLSFEHFSTFPPSAANLQLDEPACYRVETLVDVMPVQFIDNRYRQYLCQAFTLKPAVEK